MGYDQIVPTVPLSRSPMGWDKGTTAEPGGTRGTSGTSGTAHQTGRAVSGIAQAQLVKIHAFYLNPDRPSHGANGVLGWFDCTLGGLIGLTRCALVSREGGLTVWPPRSNRSVRFRGACNARAVLIRQAHKAYRAALKREADHVSS